MKGIEAFGELQSNYPEADYKGSLRSSAALLGAAAWSGGRGGLVWGGGGGGSRLTHRGLQSLGWESFVTNQLLMVVFRIFEEFMIRNDKW